MMVGKQLSDLIFDAVTATEQATEEMRNRADRFGVSAEDVTQITDELTDATNAELLEISERADAVIDAAVTRIDEEEAADRVKRTKDTAYLNRLKTKTGLLRDAVQLDAGGVPRMDRGELEGYRELFAEFENDPLAITVIRNVPGGSLVAPDDMTGSRQRKLELIKKLFAVCLDRINPRAAIRKAAAAFTGEPLRMKSWEGFPGEIEAFRAYLEMQSADFNRSDAEIFAQIEAANPGMKNACGIWRMRIGV